ncbi:MAG: hypothetical protein ACTSXG_03010 [Alphaproteobacteria bacterium]
MKKIFPLFAVLSLFMAGCNIFDKPTSQEIIESGWAKHVSYDTKYKQRSLYCYTTLGNIVCYKKPLKGAEDRLIKYGAKSFKKPQIQESDSRVDFKINPEVALK